MVVLFISHSSSLYGSSKSLVDLIEDLRNRYDIKPIVLTPDKGDLIDTLEAKNIDYVVSKFYWWVYLKNDYNPFKICIKKIINRIYLYKILYLLRCYNIDLIHSNTSVIDIGYHFANKKGIPHIWHIREDIRNAFKFEYNCSHKKVRKYFQSSKHIVGVSDFIGTQHSDIIEMDKFIRIYDGIEINHISSKEFNEKQVNLCIVGAIDDNKNQLEVIKAMKILDRKYDNIVLNIIGEGDEKYINILNKYINTYNLENKIKFWGYRNDINNILKNMDIGIMASKNEAFGRVTIEYMANYMPVIGSNSGGTKELIKHGKNGLLYELGNENDLANKIEYIIENKSEMIRMGKEGRTFVCDNFNFKMNTDKIYELYKN